MRGVEQHAFHQHSLRLLRALQGAGTNRRIRENQAGRPAGRHAVAPGRHGVPRPAAREASRRPHTGAPERSGRTVGVTSGTPALISWHCGALAALFPLVRFGGTRPSRVHAAGGIAAAASRRPHCEFKEAQRASKTRASNAGAGAIAMNCDRPSARGGGKGYNSSRVRFTGQRSGTASHTPRRALSAPAGAAAAPGFSGSPKNLDRSSICKMGAARKTGKRQEPAPGPSETGSGGVAPDRVTHVEVGPEHAGQRSTIS